VAPSARFERLINPYLDGWRTANYHIVVAGGTADNGLEKASRQPAGEEYDLGTA